MKVEIPRPLQAEHEAPHVLKEEELALPSVLTSPGRRSSDT